MQELIDLLKSDNYILILNLVIIFLVISFIISIIYIKKLNNKYKRFLKKLGNGRNIEEDLRKITDKVDNVENQNIELSSYYKKLDKNLSKCIQKIGIVRYNAFKDTGSDLSFAAALLDNENNGLVFNGIYSREMSTIYAKPVEKGISKYTLSNEEIEAINKAIHPEI